MFEKAIHFGARGGARGPPSDVLAQLGSRVQHQLRAHTRAGQGGRRQATMESPQDPGIGDETCITTAPPGWERRSVSRTIDGRGWPLSMFDHDDRADGVTVATSDRRAPLVDERPVRR
ncbi:MAG: DUF853 family protein [Microbacteriaceae bacterium]|nr:DUF853 family protein [Microbacteriaceae bacterium]